MKKITLALAVLLSLGLSNLFISITKDESAYKGQSYLHRIPRLMM